MLNPIRVLFLVCLFATPVVAQEPPPEHQHTDSQPVDDPHTDHQHAEHQHAVTAANGWTVAADANIIGGFNYQDRKYFDFAA